MILGMEIAMVLYGLYALVTGKFTLSKSRVIYGTRARVAGFICLLPIPLAFGAGFAIGSSNANVGTWSIVGLELGIVIACLVVALAIVWTAPEDEKIKNS